MRLCVRASVCVFVALAGRELLALKDSIHHCRGGRETDSIGRLQTCLFGARWVETRNQHLEKGEGEREGKETHTFVYLTTGGTIAKER